MELIVHWRRFVRKILNSYPNAKPRELVYLQKWPWLLPLIPLGQEVSSFQGKGIKFDNFSGDTLFDQSRFSVIYLLDEFGRVLSSARAAKGHYLYEVVQAAISVLWRDEGDVRYVVWRSRSPGGQAHFLIYRVTKGSIVSAQMSQIYEKEVAKALSEDTENIAA